MATKFRQWATKTLRAHIINGYTINKSRIKYNYDAFLQSVADIQALLPDNHSIDPKNILELICRVNTFHLMMLIVQKFDQPDQISYHDPMNHKMANVKYMIPVTFFKEKNAFVAYSPVLDLSSSGKTFEQAQSRFQEAADIFFEETVERGTLDEVLSSLGWTKIKQQWMPPVEVAHHSQAVNIPQLA